MKRSMMMFACFGICLVVVGAMAGIVPDTMFQHINPSDAWAW